MDDFSSFFTSRFGGYGFLDFDDFYDSDFGRIGEDLKNAVELKDTCDAILTSLKEEMSELNEIVRDTTRWNSYERCGSVNEANKEDLRAAIREHRDDIERVAGMVVSEQTEEGNEGATIPDPNLIVADEELTIIEAYAKHFPPVIKGTVSNSVKLLNSIREFVSANDIDPKDVDQASAAMLERKSSFSDAIPEHELKLTDPVRVDATDAIVWCYVLMCMKDGTDKTNARLGIVEQSAKDIAWKNSEKNKELKEKLVKKIESEMLDRAFSIGLDSVGLDLDDEDDFLLKSDGFAGIDYWSDVCSMDILSFDELVEDDDDEYDGVDEEPVVPSMKEAMKEVPAKKPVVGEDKPEEEQERPKTPESIMDALNSAFGRVGFTPGDAMPLSLDITDGEDSEPCVPNLVFGDRDEMEEGGAVGNDAEPLDSDEDASFDAGTDNADKEEGDNAVERKEIGLLCDTVVPIRKDKVSFKRGKERFRRTPSFKTRERHSKNWMMETVEPASDGLHAVSIQSLPKAIDAMGAYAHVRHIAKTDTDLFRTIRVGWCGEEPLTLVERSLKRLSSDMINISNNTRAVTNYYNKERGIQITPDELAGITHTNGRRKIPTSDILAYCNKIVNDVESHG